MQQYHAFDPVQPPEEQATAPLATRTMTYDDRLSRLADRVAVLESRRDHSVTIKLACVLLGVVCAEYHDLIFDVLRALI